ncbi:MAG: FAD-binding oxidoreductase [Spirochaetaceae bacterium]|nr:MAG: FAD-binding oxidoreductase [Spirochaetaceae bacterium]
MSFKTTEQLLHPVDPDYLEYLRDESRLTGEAESISFPTGEEQVQEIVKLLADRQFPVTIQSGRTGISGGAVPEGGHVLNLSRMNIFLGLRYDPKDSRFLLRLQPGVLLSQINEAVAKKEFPTDGWSRDSLEALEIFRQSPPYFFPPDPTESTAAIGGMAANNASGARSFYYGPTRRYIESLRIVLSDGSLLHLRRGLQRASGLGFQIESEEGRRLSGTLPSYTMPATKNTAGLYARPDMDLIDLFIGSEGTLGIMTEIEIILIALPRVISGVMGFFQELSGSIKFVKRIRGDSQDRDKLKKPAAVEFFDGNSLALLRWQKRSNPAFAEIPEVPAETAAAVYVEYHGDDPEALEEQIFQLAEILAECGGDEDTTWLAEQPRDLERLKEFRHALPEAINLLIDERRKNTPDLIKLGTDMAVPDTALDGIVALYLRDLNESGLEYVLFGHIGNNHIHVNILPRSMEEYERGRQLYKSWAQQVVAMSGSVSAEHGIGKLKTELLQGMYGEQGVEEMRRVIEVFNPKNRLNRGNIVGILPESETGT